MKTAIQHLYRPSHEGDGLLYVWFPSMHTRVDILLCSQKSEEELLSVAERIHEALSCLEKTANYYDPASELAVVNRTASVSPVVLSSQLYAMVDLCLEYHEKTSGCFDVTVHSENYNQDYKRQNKLFHFHKTFCSEFDIINTKQNVHFTKVVSPIFQFCLSLHQFSIGAKVPFINKRD